MGALFEWRKRSPYAGDLDFLFPSAWHKGQIPLSPDSILEKSIRPALQKEGIVGKRIGWHSFRHSLATNLRSLGVEIKVARELLRHSRCRTTLDIYTRAADQQKRAASLRVVEMMLPPKMGNLLHPSAPSTEERTSGRCRQIEVRKGVIGGPGRDRTDDLFHAMEARSQLRHRPTRAGYNFIIFSASRRFVKLPARLLSARGTEAPNSSRFCTSFSASDFHHISRQRLSSIIELRATMQGVKTKCSISLTPATSG
jgi:hypothetical protein